MTYNEFVLNKFQDVKMSEVDKVVYLIKEIGCHRLGHWDGCCCSHFSIRNVNVAISCGKAGEQSVKVSSRDMEYRDLDTLKPVMQEVINQVTKNSGRGGVWAQYIITITTD